MLLLNQFAVILLEDAQRRNSLSKNHDCENCITVINFIADLAGLDGYEVGIAQTVDFLKV